VLSAGSGTSAWPSSSLPFPSFGGSCGGWRCRGGCSFSSPHCGKPRCSSPAFSRFQRCVRRVFQAYCGRRGPVLRGPVREGLAILQGLPARFLRSSPSSISEGRDGLPYSPPRREYVVEFHSLPYSTFSMSMAPIDGVYIRDHPLVKRLVRGGVQGEALAPGFPSAVGSSQGP
jgi:hypothetical protein